MSKVSDVHDQMIPDPTDGPLKGGVCHRLVPPLQVHRELRDGPQRAAVEPLQRQIRGEANNGIEYVG